MFPSLEPIERGLRSYCRALRPDDLTGQGAASAIERLARIEKLAAGARIRLARRVDESAAGAEGDEAREQWLAKTTGQSRKDAAKDIEASEQLDALPATDKAVREGELSPTQAREVASAAGADPTAELELLDTARNASVPELRRKAKRVRAAATDEADKADRAHQHRDLSSGTDEESGEAWAHAKGPTTSIAEMLAHLEPWVQARFDRARRQGRRERRGALAYDALLDALRYASACRGGTAPTPGGDGSGPGPVGPPAKILARLDVTAALRGHTVAGETCEIDGLGPVPVEALRRLLPQATIDLILTNGVDVFNVTHLGRRANARQQIVLDWFGGQCSRLGCSATRHLQVDHRIDWATIKITELRNLDWLCVADHRRKSHEGWALVAGRGKRRMVPPEHPDHPANAPPSSGDPPEHRAA